MPSPVITITRQYGSGGSAVAKRAAESLGWTLIDNEFVEEVARRAGLPAEEVAQREEYVKVNYSRHRQDPLNYDMVLNTGRLGLDGAADLIVVEVRRRGWK